MIFVIITHYLWSEEQRLELLFPFYIDMAVPIFMILSGFVFAKSYVRNHCNNFKQSYSVRHVLKRLIRFTLPFATIWIIEQLYFIVIVKTQFNIKSLIVSFCTGGEGPGGYYFPILIQFIFIFPLVYLLIKRFDLKGFLALSAINLLFEISKTLIGLDVGIYRLVILRYLFVIAFGCYLAIGKKNLNLIMSIVMLLLGLVYIIVFCYLRKPFIMNLWTGTSMLACSYVAPITAYLIGKKISFKPLNVVGKASYNIFLFQMMYYLCISNYIYEFITIGKLQLICSVFICLLGGLIFYYIESKVTNKLLKILKL